jgi:hypothetical protein
VTRSVTRVTGSDRQGVVVVASGGGDVAVVTSVGGARGDDEGADVTVVTTRVDSVCGLVVRCDVDIEEGVEEIDDDDSPPVDGVVVVALCDVGT